MRYKTLITDKLISIENGLNQATFHAERGQIAEYRNKVIQLKEIVDEIQTLINTQDEQY